MILKFPHFDVLRLALTSGAVPQVVSQAPAIAGLEGPEGVWVEPSIPLPRAALNDLRRLGVQIAKAGSGEGTVRVSCWPEVLPLQSESRPITDWSQTPVLFDLKNGEQLARLVTEILRLGNDRQSFRWLEPTDKKGDVRSLLRVIGPPYYSLLQALDREEQADAPQAFTERAPGVWVQVGYGHPLAEQIKPPAGNVLLLRPPRQWVVLPDGHFRDVYEVIEFSLPKAPTDWHDQEWQERIRVVPRLTAGGPGDGAELWVLHENAVEELNRFVQASDDQLLHRLAFAVGQRDGRQVVALRVRPSKLPPPTLVLPAQGYRTYLRLPNLFLPCGTRLRPPLRRDVVRRLLAADLDKITWLTPGPDDSFTPESLPESSFRPLADWVDYVLEKDREELQAWVQAAQFDFEAFVCSDERSPKPKRPPTTDRKGAEKKSRKTAEDGLETPEPTAFPDVKKGQKPSEKDSLPDLLETVLPEPSEAQKRLRELEDQFLAIEGGLDAPERQGLWPEMANLHAALSAPEEAGNCWLHALWEREDAPEPWTRAWFRAEAVAVPARSGPGKTSTRSWASQASLAGAAGGEVSGSDLDRLLGFTEPTPTDVRALAAYLVGTVGHAPASTAIQERLPALRRFLETWEKLLPVRAVWLVWTALSRLSGGDVLALARARDRLLERLFQNGLRADQDLPSFLRSGGKPGGAHSGAMRPWLAELLGKVQAWVAETGPIASVPMKGYVDLLFAFGMARLGEHGTCRELLQRASAELAGKDWGDKAEVHSFLLQAFHYRITQALEGKPHGGPLPPEQLEYLDAMEKEGGRSGKGGGLNRYAIDRLRKQSRILEPDQDLDPYRHLKARKTFEKELAALPDVVDREEVAARLLRLFQEVRGGQGANEARAFILTEALNQAPRIGEDFAREILGRVLPVYDVLAGSGPRQPDELSRLASLLEKGLFTAAHFDRMEHVSPLVERFASLLRALHGSLQLETLSVLAGQSLRSLRKLGMRDQIDHLLGLMAEVVLHGRDLRALAEDPIGTRADSLRALLQVAGGWYYFGRDQQAEAVLEAARALIFREELDSKKRVPLVCDYAATAGQGPPEKARLRLTELFSRLQGLKETWTTSGYYARYQFEIVEAVILAVVSETFSLGASARRWLDEEEFLIRRRVHRDVRTALGG
jgi:hypothetical protein